MTGRLPQRLSSRALRVLAMTALVAVAAMIDVLTPASATARWDADGHRMVASDPAAGAALTTAPAAIELVFPAPVAVDLSHVSVQADGGASATTGPLGQPARGTVRQPVRIPGSGTFTVAYHVTFVDGTEDTGLVRFSVGTGVPPPPLHATAAERAVGEAAHSHSIDPLSAVLLVVDGLVVVVVLTLLLRRGRPDP